MRALLAWIVPGLVLLAACRDPAADAMALPRSETLPGFTLSLPSGKPLRDQRTPAAGEVLVRKHGGVLAVGWQAGVVSKAELPGFLELAAGALGAAIGGGGAAPTAMTLAEPDYGMEVVLPTDKKVVLVMSLVQCVRSRATITLASMVSTDTARARAFHARWTATLRCDTAGAALTASAGLPAFDLGADIAYLPESDPPSYYALDGRRWHVTPGVPALRKSFEQAGTVAAMFEGMGLRVRSQRTVATTTPGWLQLELAVEADGATGTVLAGVLVCGEAAFSVIALNPTALTAPLPARELERVSCPGPSGVGPAELPPVPTRFGDACDAGDALACTLLADLAGEEAALLPGLDAGVLRARACQLGRTQDCPTAGAAPPGAGADAAP